VTRDNGEKRKERLWGGGAEGRERKRRVSHLAGFACREAIGPRGVARRNGGTRICVSSAGATARAANQLSIPFTFYSRPAHAQRHGDSRSDYIPGNNSSEQLEGSREAARSRNPVPVSSLPPTSLSLSLSLFLFLSATPSLPPGEFH